MTRVEFLRFLENVLWKAGDDVPQFTFPIVRVLPGTLLRFLNPAPVPVQPPAVLIEEISPSDEEQALREVLWKCFLFFWPLWMFLPVLFSIWPVPVVL